MKPRKRQIVHVTTSYTSCQACKPWTNMSFGNYNGEPDCVDVQSTKQNTLSYLENLMSPQCRKFHPLSVMIDLGEALPPLNASIKEPLRKLCNRSLSILHETCAETWFHIGWHTGPRLPDSYALSHRLDYRLTPRLSKQVNFNVMARQDITNWHVHTKTMSDSLNMHIVPIN